MKRDVLHGQHGEKRWDDRMVDPPGSLGFDIPNFWRQEVFPVRSGRVDSHDISIGDKLIKPRSVGVYRAHEIRIPIKGGMTIPNIGS